MVRVLFTLFTVKSIRKPISEHPRTPELLEKALSATDPTVIVTLPTIVRRMTLTPDFIKKLGQSGFIKGYIQKTMSSDSIDAKSSCIMLCDTLARICYLQDFNDLVPSLATLLGGSTVLSQSALTLAVVFYSHKEMREVMKNSQIKEALLNMRVSPSFEQYRNALLQQL